MSFFEQEASRKAAKAAADALWAQKMVSQHIVWEGK